MNSEKCKRIANKNVGDMTLDLIETWLYLLVTFYRVILAMKLGADTLKICSRGMAATSYIHEECECKDQALINVRAKSWFLPLSY